MKRKHRLVLALIAAVTPLSVASFAEADCTDPFGKPGELLDFHLQMTRADWNGLVADNPGEACNAIYKDFKAQFRCGVEGPWMKVAVRKKRGEQRGVEAPQKPPMKIDFNETFNNTVPEAMGQSWPPRFGKNGYRKLTLNNGQGNKFGNTVIPLPLLMAEHVAMRLLKVELPSAPGTAYAKITVHTEDKPEGEYHGVYILLEDIDRPALRRRFTADTGRLIKNSKDACPSEPEFEDVVPNAAKTAWDAWYPSAANGTLEAAEKGVDLDTLLRQEAIREILVNGDDTIATSVSTGGMGLNWYYYDLPTGLRHFIPWDTDLTFGQQNENCAPNSLKCLPTERIGRWCAMPSGVGRATVCNTNVRKRYLEIMCQLINGSMAAEEMLKVWESAYQTVKDVVPMEKHLWGGRDPSSTTIDKSFGSEYVRLKAWIPLRINSVRSQIMCAAGCPAGKVEPCAYLSCMGERRCENNRWTACRPVAACSAGMAPPLTTDAGAPTTDGGSPSDAGPTGSGGSGGGGTPGTGGSASGGGSGSTATGGSNGGMATGGSNASGSGGASSGSGGRAGNNGSGGSSGGPTSQPAGGESTGCQCELGERGGPSPSSSSSLVGLGLAVGLALRVRRVRRRLRRQ